MGTEQETLIYIEDQDKLDASVAANAFAHKDVKNRAYINTLGAELALKYLASEDIDVSNIYNIHSIKKILEEMKKEGRQRFEHGQRPHPCPEGVESPAIVK